MLIVYIDELTYPEDIWLRNAELQKFPTYNDDFPDYADCFENITEDEIGRLKFNHHCIIQTSSLESNIKINTQSDDSFEDPETKDVLKIESISLSDIEEDVKNTPKFSCSKCYYTTAEEKWFQIHTLTHFDKGFLCDVCGHKSKHSGAFLIHLNMHYGEKNFGCNFCDFKSHKRETVVKHLRTHTNEKPYSCDWCDFKTGHSSVIRTHLFIHSNTKPYSCRLCSYKSTKNINLKVHMRTHTGERSFVCGICDYKASHKVSLRSHIMSHLRGNKRKLKRSK